MGKKFLMLALLGLGQVFSGCSLPPDRQDDVVLLACETKRVKDGDSVLATCEGRDVELRLLCIDAPELNQKRYGAQAKKALTVSLGVRFQARIEGEDLYGRSLATLWRNDQDLNLKMVRQGQAMVYRKYCGKTKYLLAESEAAKERLGVWDGMLPFVTPWEWRRR